MLSHAHGRPGQHALWSTALMLLLVFADQYTKWVVIETMLRIEGDAPDFMTWFMTHKPIAFFIVERENFNTVTLTPWLNLVMVWNEGISFGLFDNGKAFMPFIFIAISMMIAMPMLIWMCLTPKKSVALALGLIVAGAIGNVIDRVRFGAVADFVDVHVAGKHWPAFNLADSCIVIGAGILMLDALLSPKKE